MYHELAQPQSMGSLNQIFLSNQLVVCKDFIINRLLENFLKQSSYNFADVCVAVV